MTLKKIVLQLTEKGHPQEASYLLESEKIGSTGGEIFDILIFRLINLKKKAQLPMKSLQKKQT